MTALPQYALKYTCGHYYCGCHGRRMNDGGDLGLECHASGWRIKEILSPCPACQGPSKRLRPIPYEDLPPVSGGLV